MWRLLVYTDQPLLAAGIRTLIGSSTNYVLSAVCSEQTQLWLQLRVAQPNLLVIDLGSEFDLRLLCKVREIASEVRTVVLGRNFPPEVVLHAHELGVVAVLDTRVPLDELDTQLLRILEGEILFDPSSYSDKSVRTVRLTHRESDLVALLAQGLKNKEIATELGITEGTVKVYFSKLFQKLGVKDRFELALFGLKNGFAPGGPLMDLEAMNALDGDREPGHRQLSQFRQLVLREGGPGPGRLPMRRFAVGG